MRVAQTVYMNNYFYFSPGLDLNQEIDIDIFRMSGRETLNLICSYKKSIDIFFTRLGHLISNKGDNLDGF